MKNIPQYTMLALITFGVVTVANTQYFSRNTGVVPNSRDRYQYNLPVNSPNNTYNSSPPIPYALNPLFADKDAVRQQGQPEVPQYSKERDINKSALMQEDRAVAQQQAQPIAQQDPTTQAQQTRIPAGYGPTMQQTNMPTQSDIPMRDPKVSVR